MADNKILREEDVKERLNSRAKRLLTENQQSPTTEFGKGTSNIKFGGIDQVAKINAGERVSNQVILESNPNLSRAIEILAGLITCPNGGSTVTLTYDADVLGADNRYTDNAINVCKILDGFFTKTYKLPSKLPTMVRDTLGETGSYITAFIPDSNINSMLANTGLESEATKLTNELDLAQLYSVGLEGDGTKQTTKANSKSAITYTSNPDILKLRSMREALLHNKGTTDRKVTYNAGLESDDVQREASVMINPASILKRRRLYKTNPVARMGRSKGDEETSRAMIMHMPSESCSPMIFRGEPDEPFGYIFALDADGYPVTCDEEIDFDKDLRSMGKENEEDKFIKRIANNFAAGGAGKSYGNINDLYREFRQYLEADVYAKVTDGTYGEDYTLDEDSLLSKIAFHRLLRNQKTHLLYLPTHLVNYFCYDVDSLGIGRSLVSRTKALSNIYTVLFYANFMGSLSNAIPRKLVTIDFDKEDFDKNKRMEEIVNKLVMSQVGNFDFDYRGPSDLMNNLMKHGLEFKMNNVEDGDIPAMDIDIVDKKREIRPIDNTTLDNVSKLISMRVGFAPNVIDQSYSARFSSEVVRDNDLTARQVAAYILKTSDKISDHCVKYTINDPILMGECLSVIKGDDKEGTLSEILANLVVTTPTTESSGIAENVENIQEIINAVNEIVDNLYPRSYIATMGGTSEAEMADFQETLKASLLEDYMRTNTSFKNMIDDVIDLDKLGTLFENQPERHVGLMPIFSEY